MDNRRDEVVQIARSIKDLTEADVLIELTKLKKIDIEKLPENSKIGSKVIDYYTLHERMKVRMQKCYRTNFYEFLCQEEKFSKQHTTIKYFQYIGQEVDWKDMKKVWKLWNFYYGYSSNFNTLVGIKLLKQYKPKIVLDPFASWGSRLLASYIGKADKYIGIESNLNLEKCYSEMMSLYKNFSVEMIFKNNMFIDYSTLDYDFVLTKVPYYNQELHEYQSYLSENEINENYGILFRRIFDNLKEGGYMCLNASNKVYKSVLNCVLGSAVKYKIFKRNRKNKRVEGLDEYDEIIYIWKKETHP
jgi:hypothetical protein